MASFIVVAVASTVIVFIIVFLVIQFIIQFHSHSKELRKVRHGLNDPDPTHVYI